MEEEGGEGTHTRDDHARLPRCLSASRSSRSDTRLRPVRTLCTPLTSQTYTMQFHVSSNSCLHTHHHVDLDPLVQAIDRVVERSVASVAALNRPVGLQRVQRVDEQRSRHHSRSGRERRPHRLKASPSPASPPRRPQASAATANPQLDHRADHHPPRTNSLASVQCAKDTNATPPQCQGRNSRRDVRHARFPPAISSLSLARVRASRDATCRRA